MKADQQLRAAVHPSAGGVPFETSAGDKGGVQRTTYNIVVHRCAPVAGRHPDVDDTPKLTLWSSALTLFNPATKSIAGCKAIRKMRRFSPFGRPPCLP